MHKLLCFETCPRCVHVHRLPISRSKYWPIEQILEPMVLSGDDREMQCSVCNHSFKLPDCEAVRDMARHRRGVKYDGR